MLLLLRLLLPLILLDGEVLLETSLFPELGLPGRVHCGWCLPKTVDSRLPERHGTAWDGRACLVPKSGSS